jgi:hypothetical protein
MEQVKQEQLRQMLEKSQALLDPPKPKTPTYDEAQKQKEIQQQQ